jgi:hypothetical protein
MGEVQVSTEIDFSKLFKDVVFAALIKVATQSLISALPFLGWGPIGWITGLVVSIVGSAIYDALDEAFRLQMMVFKNEAYQKQWDTASVKLKIAYKNYGPDSPEYKKARKENVEALTNLISFNPK